MKRPFRISTRNPWRNSQILTQTRKRFKNNLMTCRLVAMWHLSSRLYFTRWVMKRHSETLTLLFQTIIYDFPSFCSDQNMWFSLLYFRTKFGIFPTLFQTWTNIFNATDPAAWPFPDPLSWATNLSLLQISWKLYPIEDLKDLSKIPRRWDCTYPQCMQLIKGEFPPRVFDSLMFSAPVSVNPKTKKAGLFKNGNLSS